LKPLISRGNLTFSTVKMSYVAEISSVLFEHLKNNLMLRKVNRLLIEKDANVTMAPFHFMAHSK